MKKKKKKEENSIPIANKYMTCHVPGLAQVPQQKVIGLNY
jgi:hypothetical protein